MTPLLEASRLSFAFSTRRTVFEDISFTLARDEKAGLVGANGAGKSTLLWCLLGLLKPRGEVRFFGERLTRGHLDRVGVVFQNPEEMLFMPTLLDDLTLPLLNRGWPAAEAAGRAQEVLQLVELAEFAGSPAANLSLGQRKRAAIAAALAPKPDLLLLDEPTAELDGRSARRLADLLESMDVTFLTASHDLAFLRRVTRRLMVIHEGRIIADGPTTSVLADESRLEQVGLI